MNYSGWAPGPRAFGDFYRRDILYGNAGPTGIRGELKPPTRRRRRRRLRRRRGGGEEGERKDLFFSGGGERRPESTYLPVGLLLNPRSRLMDSSSPDRCMRTYDTNRPAPASFLGLVLLLSLPRSSPTRRSCSFLAMPFVRVARDALPPDGMFSTNLFLSHSGLCR